MEKKLFEKRTIKRMIPYVLALVLISISFQSCQKDEILLNDFENESIQLKSATISIGAIDALIDKIENYETAGVLDSKLANVFIKELENVKKSLEKGNEKAAENLLQAIIYQLEGMVKAGNIETSIGEGLISQLESMVGEYPTFTDTRDGHVYKIVTIGNQTWMAENLAYDAGTGCYAYNNDESNVAIYGRLYTWNAAMAGGTTPGAQGISPDGWHIPTIAEWEELRSYLGGEEVAGGKMKTTGTIQDGTGLWVTPNTAATNESGFSGLPGGIVNYSGNSEAIGIYGFWWSSNQTTTTTAANMRLDFGSGYLVRQDLNKIYGQSIRCIKDSE
ncbi:hypothetical protein D1164_17955 [Mariniphaga sediminis]|uniref:Uncharacterized protein n=1 Tax=Mariniphaga sediminis TaxID=1628158 RepID=A0A399CWE3_9BACT|nr:fibrobacter succinogenes major paralogous domain-containing protein [Mariniphaga sediminis]RIH63819.1 hypothetical protein D1164_17955 [Mariniphaga sediminis]